MSNFSAPDLLKQLKWRYATKQFDASKKIPQDLWEALEDSLILTPSSFGLQPWHFFVIENPELREKLQAHSWGQAQVTECSHFLVLASRRSVGEEEIDQFLKHSAKLRGEQIESLAPYRDMMSGFIGHMDESQKAQWAKLQTYIALGQLMTSAAALGIDACPMEGIDANEYDALLGLPEKGLKTSVACALGYRAESDKYASAAKVRFEKNQLLTRL